MSLAPLPIDAHLPAIVQTLARRRALVLVAPPGAGKTTRVPPALDPLGPVLVLQPRRVAARSIARRIAEEQGLALGEEVGWQVRFERRFSPRTRILVATEGILTARLREDPLLAGFGVAVLDEFHERSLHADLALAFLKQALAAREDLRLLVMSATLEAGPVAAYLGDAPVIEVEARAHPVEIRHAPELAPAAAIREACASGAGHVLCFLPGLREIDAVRAELRAGLRPDAELHRLHGALDPAEQDAALRPSARRKIVLATNLAETSLTVDGVTAVVDSGLQRTPRYDPARGLDRLETERVARDSAEQRAGRAGRTGPGLVLRLWDPRLVLRPRREPELRRVDLAAPVLEVLGWGADPSSFEWFEAPETARLQSALELLRRLGALEGRSLTPLGSQLVRLPLHPRLGRVLLAAGGSARAALVCALLSEGRGPAPTGETTDSDPIAAADRLDPSSRPVREAARQIAALARAVTGAESAPRGPRAKADPEAALRHALLLGFPDRVAKRREKGSPRLLLATGEGALLARESGVREAEYLLALDVAGGAAPGGQALVRLASAVDRAWLRPTRTETAHWLEGDEVRAAERDFYGALLLAERPRAPDPARAEELLAEAVGIRAPSEDDAALLRRLRFAGLDVDAAGLRLEAGRGRTKLAAGPLAELLPPPLRRALEGLAPEALSVPSGRRVRLEYREDGSVHASVKLQELFGLADGPMLGPRSVPVTFSLLAPNGRPVQVTRDLRSFWEKGYPEVRRELRGRYPRHPWPDDPWTAPPTGRAKPRR